jgi:serine/threonine protein kinase
MSERSSSHPGIAPLPDPAQADSVLTCDTVVLPQVRLEAGALAAEPEADLLDLGPAPEPLPGWPTVPGYEILGEIGRGRTAVVYRARQVTLNRCVALKVLDPARLSSPEELRRIRGEARAAARLNHPHLVPIHEWTCTPWAPSSTRC